MYKSDSGALIVSPTDLTRFVGCEHRTSLDLQVVSGTRPKPPPSNDEVLELLFAKGNEHERKYLAALRATRDVVEIPGHGTPTAERVAATDAAIRAGADVIYQAAFFHDGRVGYADFLLRADRPSELGHWSYDVADTKLARKLKVPALLQMASYGEHLRRLQGEPPVWLTVVAGDGQPHPFPFADVEAYARRLVGRFDGFVADPPVTVAEPVAECDQCSWARHCNAGWRAADHLSYVAFLGRGHRKLLEAADIRTMADLGTKTVDDLPSQINAGSRERILRQARLQLSERADGHSHYELLEPAAGLGLLRLPAPDAADLYLDFEADRWVEPDGREFLAGIGDTTGGFEALWAHSEAEEKQLTEDLIDHITVVWRSNPGMHVYHYAPYEKSALTRLVQRHATREAELDILLRADVLVDLYAVVRQGMQVSKESYSIKKLEAFYWGAERRKNAEVAEAVSSTLYYEKWLLDNDPALLDAIEAYNKDDVDSTRDLHRWLEQRRAELCTSHGTAFERPAPPEVEATEPSEAERAEQALTAELIAAGEDLLAGLVGWHRREDRPGWWEFFHYADLATDELITDSTAVGALGIPEYQRDVKRSHVWRYYLPAQETRLAVGDQAFDVDTRKSVGMIAGLDLIDGWVDLQFAKQTPAPTPRGLQPVGPINTTVLRASIAAVAKDRLTGASTLSTRLIDGVVPTPLPVRDGETPADALVRIGTQLDGAVLAVQGPPGTGKSWNAARLIRALLDDPRRLKVGVTALSHAVIGGLLTTVGRPALQKAEPDQWCRHPDVEATTQNKRVDDALANGDHRLIGGTAWMWARDAMRDCVDVLIVDEAGQFSLANAVAVARAAKSIVLLGDPQQLTQPTLAEHPFGSGVSALEHLLDGHATIAADRGIFFNRTWRMHPSVTDFVSRTSYDGRLFSRDENARLNIGGSGPWSGTGLRWIPVEHTGNSTSSPEEATVVAQIVDELLGRPWTDSDGATAPLGPDDVLVVAPYNVHVALLRETLPDVVRVGTVDKFQGREAAVTIYSLASSTSADAPRGIDFLYDTHRLNVAVSRAKALSIIVGSPALLDAAVPGPKQVPKVNAYCQYVEAAALMSVAGIAAASRRA